MTDYQKMVLRFLNLIAKVVVLSLGDRDDKLMLLDIQADARRLL